jgi:hypothetical protein
MSLFSHSTIYFPDSTPNPMRKESNENIQKWIYGIVKLHQMPASFVILTLAIFFPSVHKERILNYF